MSRRLNFMAVLLAMSVIGLAAGHAKEQSMTTEVARKTCRAPDGVTIVYSVAGHGEPALLFIHGGMADRSFYEAQLRGLSDRWRVIAVDLAGHGESGSNRARWGIPQFAADVKAVADAEGLKRVIIFGNSLGGPVAVEAALLLPGRAIGVVGIDTFQDLGQPRTPERERERTDFYSKRAQAFRADFPAAAVMGAGFVTGASLLLRKPAAQAVGEAGAC